MTGVFMKPGRIAVRHDRRNEKMEEKYYFAYGSNMNLEQMEFRCPHAEVVGKAVLKDHRLAFRGSRTGHGVASVLPEKGKEVHGLLWKITPLCERSLDFYEGYPHLYGKEEITVQTKTGEVANVKVYVMNEPYQSQPALPSTFYLEGILQGCRQNGLSEREVRQAVKETKQEISNKEKSLKIRPKMQADKTDPCR